MSELHAQPRSELELGVFDVPLVERVPQRGAESNPLVEQRPAVGKGYSVAVFIDLGNARWTHPVVARKLRIDTEPGRTDQQGAAQRGAHRPVVNDIVRLCGRRDDPRLDGRATGPERVDLI